jgi:hypothetical protein
MNTLLGVRYIRCCVDLASDDLDVDRHNLGIWLSLLLLFRAEALLLVISS